MVKQTMRVVPMIILASVAMAQMTAAGAASGRNDTARILRQTGSASESVLYTFLGYASGHSDGFSPRAPLISDDGGAFYGTTMFGGNGRCYLGCGTVFKLTPSTSGYAESIIYTFHDSDGRWPVAGLLADAAGDLFGTTSHGGDTKCHQGCGTVFELTPSTSGYREVVIYHFHRDYAGKFPMAGLIADAGGNLYGTTEDGGTHHCGTVFMLKRTRSGYAKSTLYNFECGNDGQAPLAPLVMGPEGTLYGTTFEGGGATGCGGGCGTVFALRRSQLDGRYQETIAHSFGTGNDGAWPFGGVIVDKRGALYGTASTGGTGCPQESCGVVFRLTPSESGYAETILYNFQGNQDCDPHSELLADGAGNLFGTATGDNCYGGGTVFELRPSASGTYSERILHAFSGLNDGSAPLAGLIADKHGALYGTTSSGGNYLFGTVFKVVL